MLRMVPGQRLKRTVSIERTTLGKDYRGKQRLQFPSKFLKRFMENDLNPSRLTYTKLSGDRWLDDDYSSFN